MSGQIGLEDLLEVELALSCVCKHPLDPGDLSLPLLDPILMFLLIGLVSWLFFGSNNLGCLEPGDLLILVCEELLGVGAGRCSLKLHRVAPRGWDSDRLSWSLKALVGVRASLVQGVALDLLPFAKGGSWISRGALSAMNGDVLVVHVAEVEGWHFAFGTCFALGSNPIMLRHIC